MRKHITNHSKHLTTKPLGSKPLATAPRTILVVTHWCVPSHAFCTLWFQYHALQSRKINFNLNCFAFGNFSFFVSIPPTRMSQQQTLDFPMRKQSMPHFSYSLLNFSLCPVDWFASQLVELMKWLSIKWVTFPSLQTVIIYE